MYERLIGLQIDVEAYKFWSCFAREEAIIVAIDLSMFN